MTNHIFVSSSDMYTEQYNSSTNDRMNQVYYLDSLSYSSYGTNTYPFRQQPIPSSNIYFSSSSSTTQSDYPNYFNVANYPSHSISDSFEMNFSRHINSNESDLSDRQISSSTIRKRKFHEETIKSSYESETCRVCDDQSSGYHFGVFTCEACKGFFRRYSKKSTILEPCPSRCSINKNNRNNCAACRFDKCKSVGMALDKIRFGKPPKIFRSTFPLSTVKLEPNEHDFQLMLKLLECYQSFEESDHSSPTISTIIFQFCHRLANIVMLENECLPETFFTRLKRHESAIQFLITGENDQNFSSWSQEPQAWIFAHNERWRLIMILLILAFDDEDRNENLDHPVLERILRLFELECDQEKDGRIYPDGSNTYSNISSEKNVKYMKAQFVLRFIDMMTNDMINNRMDLASNLINPYMISEDNLYLPINQFNENL